MRPAASTPGRLLPPGSGSRPTEVTRGLNDRESRRPNQWVSGSWAPTTSPRAWSGCNAFGGPDGYRTPMRTARRRGRGQGAHPKHAAPAFKTLAAFVAANHPGPTVTQFCQQVVASHTEPSTTPTTESTSDTEHGHGTPPSTEGGTGVADTHSGGASEHGTDKANDSSDGRSAGGSGNAGSHRP